MRVTTCSTLRSARIAWRRSEAAVEGAELPRAAEEPAETFVGSVESVELMEFMELMEKGDMCFLLIRWGGNGASAPGGTR